MVSKASEKTISKKDDAVYVNPQNVSFLLCYKYNNPIKETDLDYYEVIPYFMSNTTKAVDLRTLKAYKLKNTAQTNMEKFGELLASYGVRKDSNPTYCGVIEYVTALNVAALNGVKSKIFLGENLARLERIPQELLVSFCDDFANHARLKNEKARLCDVERSF